VKALAIVALACALAHAAPPAPSGPLKAYRGPEGELVVMVEADDGKQMYVHMKKIGGALDGKTVLYRFEDLGHGTKHVWIDKKRGSKTYRSYLLEARDNQWDFFHPTNPKINFNIRYSEKDSEAVRIEDVLKAYNP
jgi:hypothetical protein